MIWNVLAKKVDYNCLANIFTWTNSFRTCFMTPAVTNRNMYFQLRHRCSVRITIMSMIWEKLSLVYWKKFINFTGYQTNGKIISTSNEMAAFFKQWLWIHTPVKYEQTIAYNLNKRPCSNKCPCLFSENDILFWFFGDFRCGVSLFIVIRVIYKYRNR